MPESIAELRQQHTERRKFKAPPRNIIGGNWQTSHDEQFVNFVGMHENLMEPDDWTPADIGIETQAAREEKMLRMHSENPSEVRKLLKEKIRYHSNIFFSKPVEQGYCHTEMNGGLAPAEPMNPRLKGKPAWRQPVPTSAEAAPVGRAYVPYYRRGS